MHCRAGHRIRRLPCILVEIPLELQEMGPSLDLSLRRVREAPPDLMAEALRQPKTTGKKVSPGSAASLRWSISHSR